MVKVQFRGLMEKVYPALRDAANDVGEMAWKGEISSEAALNILIALIKDGEYKRYNCHRTILLKLRRK